jgi:hypothetical protein
MNDGSLPDHRRRYRVLDDRRRLRYELERIWTRIQQHPDWPNRPLPTRRALETSLDLAPCAPDAHVERLDADVRTMTHRQIGRASCRERV